MRRLNGSRHRFQLSASIGGQFAATAQGHHLERRRRLDECSNGISAVGTWPRYAATNFDEFWHVKFLSENFHLSCQMESGSMSSSPLILLEVQGRAANSSLKPILKTLQQIYCPIYFKFVKRLSLICFSFGTRQGHEQQKAAGNGGTGAEFRQFQLAAAEGTVGRIEQFGGSLPITRAE